MKNPLRKRISRELKDEFGKYLVVFLMMVLTIGFVSGFLVADGSMLNAIMTALTNTTWKTEIFAQQRSLQTSREQAGKTEGKALREFLYRRRCRLDNGEHYAFF